MPTTTKKSTKKKTTTVKSASVAPKSTSAKAPKSTKSAKPASRKSCSKEDCDNQTYRKVCFWLIALVFALCIALIIWSLVYFNRSVVCGENGSINYSSWKSSTSEEDTSYENFITTCKAEQKATKENSDEENEAGSNDSEPTVESSELEEQTDGTTESEETAE